MYNVEGYTLAYTQYRAGQRPRPAPDRYGISAYEASLARKRADTTIRRLQVPTTRPYPVHNIAA